MENHIIKENNTCNKETMKNLIIILLSLLSLAARHQLRKFLKK
jgi:hypothetical protein